MVLRGWRLFTVLWLVLSLSAAANARLVLTLPDATTLELHAYSATAMGTVFENASVVAIDAPEVVADPSLLEGALVVFTSSPHQLGVDAEADIARCRRFKCVAFAFAERPGLMPHQNVLLRDPLQLLSVDECLHTALTEHPSGLVATFEPDTAVLWQFGVVALLVGVFHLNIARAIYKLWRHIFTEYRDTVVIGLLVGELLVLIVFSVFVPAVATSHHPVPIALACYLVTITLNALLSFFHLFHWGRLMDEAKLNVFLRFSYAQILRHSLGRLAIVCIMAVLVIPAVFGLVFLMPLGLNVFAFVVPALLFFVACSVLATLNVIRIRRFYTRKHVSPSATRLLSYSHLTVASVGVSLLALVIPLCLLALPWTRYKFIVFLFPWNGLALVSAFIRISSLRTPASYQRRQMEASLKVLQLATRSTGDAVNVDASHLDPDDIEEIADLKEKNLYLHEKLSKVGWEISSMKYCIDECRFSLQQQIDINQKLRKFVRQFRDEGQLLSDEYLDDLLGSEEVDLPSYHVYASQSMHHYPDSAPPNSS